MNICKHYETCDNARKHCHNGMDCFEYRGDDDMSQYYCRACDLIVDEDELAEWNEDMGYYGSEKTYAHVVGCPRCHGGIETMAKCEKCGDIVSPNTIVCGVCSRCIDDALQDEVMLSKYASAELDNYIDWLKDDGWLDSQER